MIIEIPEFNIDKNTICFQIKTKRLPVITKSNQPVYNHLTGNGKNNRKIKKNSGCSLPASMRCDRTDQLGKEDKRHP